MEDLEKIAWCMSKIKTLLSIGSIFPKKKMNRVFFCYKIFCTFLVSALFCGSMNFAIHNINNMNRALAGLSVATSIWCLSGKGESISLYSLIWIGIFFTFKIVQIALYTVNGDLIAKEGENFENAVYSSEWFNSSDKDPRFYASMVLCQRPLVLRAWSFVDVNAKLLASVLNTTISYFFLLQTINEKNKVIEH